MEPNPILKKLGFSNTDRLIIIHTDDIGMCQSSVEAFSDLLEFGIISSGATMVPCSWFPKVAETCKHNENIDIGVHLTLTSEWDHYRWSPISTRDISSGLIDSEGYFYRSSEEMQLNGDPDAAKREMRAQIDRAFSSGIDLTHVDTHMYSIAHSKFLNGYIQLALAYKLPILLPRSDELGFQRLGLDSETITLAIQAIHYLEDLDIPLVDFVSGLDLTQPENRLEQLKLALMELPIGITHFIIHPSKDTPELRAITPDWKCRVADYITFMDEDTRKLIHDMGFHIIGYKSLKKLLL